MKIESQIQFMVDFTLPNELTQEFLTLIPHQHRKTNMLFGAKKLLSYGLSLEDRKMWAVLKAPTKQEAIEIAKCLPLSPFMRIKISKLTFYDMLNQSKPKLPLD